MSGRRGVEAGGCGGRLRWESGGVRGRRRAIAAPGLRLVLAGRPPVALAPSPPTSTPRPPSPSPSHSPLKRPQPTMSVLLQLSARAPHPPAGPGPDAAPCLAFRLCSPFVTRFLRPISRSPPPSCLPSSANPTSPSPPFSLRTASLSPSARLRHRDDEVAALVSRLPFRAPSFCLPPRPRRPAISRAAARSSPLPCLRVSLDLHR